jgi:hypothetical protein
LLTDNAGQPLPQLELIKSNGTACNAAEHAPGGDQGSAMIDNQLVCLVRLVSRGRREGDLAM